MQSYKNFLVFATAFASSSPWVEDFRGMLTQVGCRNGPKMCGYDNRYGDGGRFCSAGEGCVDFGFGWEICDDVYPWQCFRKCDEGQVLNPLRYCQCIPEEELYDMFCASDDFQREPAAEGEFCEGFNEFINGPYPDCEEGLECN